ncbi:hypothetical protein D9M69_404830 [compost metagenome]
MQGGEAVVEGEPVDEDRCHRIDERQRPGQCGRQFLDGAVEQHVHQPGMHDAQGSQAGPGGGVLRQRGEVRPGRQQRHAGEGLDQRDEVRRDAVQALDDQGRQRIQQRRAEGQGDAAEVVAAAVVAVGADDGEHAGEGNPQPGHLLQGDLLAEEHRPQQHQHERLHVVHRRADGDRCARIGGEQQQPVADDEDAAEQSEEEGGAVENAGAQQPERGADQQQGHGAEGAAPEHHVEHRLPGNQHQPADGPADQHGGDHFQGSTFDRIVHAWGLLCTGTV